MKYTNFNDEIYTVEKKESIFDVLLGGFITVVLCGIIILLAIMFQ